MDVAKLALRGLQEWENKRSSRNEAKVMEDGIGQCQQATGVGKTFMRAYARLDK